MDFLKYKNHIYHEFSNISEKWSQTKLQLTFMNKQNLFVGCCLIFIPRNRVEDRIRMFLNGPGSFHQAKKKV
jgi:hypothetical protein